MSVSHSNRWQDPDDRALAYRSDAARIPGVVWAVATPSRLTLAGAVTVGWLALVAWTGTGPDGWQARSCAEFDLGRSSCAAVRFTKDQSRIASHPQVANFTR